MTDDEFQAFADQLQRRRRRPPGPKKMSQVINGLLARRGYAQEQASHACGDAWSQAVGQPLANDSRAGSVKRGTLEVTVRNSAVLQELNFQKHGLLKRMRQAVPEQKISDLRFRVGPID